MRSERIQKRQSLSPQTVAGVDLRRPLRLQLLWLLLIPLTLVGVWAAATLHTAVAQSVKDELQLVLAAEVELAHASLRAGDPSSSERFAKALDQRPLLESIGHTARSYAFDARGMMLSPRGTWAHPGWVGHTGTDVRGYRDDRGVEVVGAWRWLPEHGLGIAVELEADEAFALDSSLQKALFAVYVMIAFALIAVGGATRMYQRGRRHIAVAEQLGQYTLVKEVGRGGMGVVYEARHAFLRRPTAVKLLTVPDGDPVARGEALLRFEREVQLTSELSHPNTVVIYDYGRSQGGTFYYAMEYIDGVDLERLVRTDGPLPAGRVIHFALQICGSLCEAHDKSLIHRDIKPANVLVCERGGLPDTIKVLDFGLVKSLLGPQVSAAHVLVGTPPFMAPEVLRSPGAADARSDIYALGAVLYWLCTGHTIFEDGSVLNTHAKLTLPSVYRPDLPVDLERAIVRCLAREPMERPLSMAELATELRACRAHGSWSTQDARRYWRERGDALLRELPAAPDVPTLAAS
ncbi:MAG TPA: serine/threonine-protein kinase [Polyangiales bacterium]|nr:serine/threonine-protein kinase [Polyangiales bacterium]